jgi:hypothetical protein
MASSTYKEIEDLLATKIAALTDGATPTPRALFAVADSMTDKEMRAPGTTPAAYVILDSSEGSDVASRLIIKDIYLVRIVAAKGTTDTARTAYALIEAVRNAIHGKDWGEAAITPLHYEDVRLADAEGSQLIYDMRFSVTRYLQIPTLT